MKQNAELYFLVHKSHKNRYAFTNSVQYEAKKDKIQKEWRLGNAEEYKKYMLEKYKIEINLKKEKKK